MCIIRFCSPAFVLLFFAAAAQAQSYKTAAGIRIDNGVQFTAQQYLFDQWTAEGILHSSIGSKNLGLTLLAEKHYKVLFRGLNIYLGAGGHYYWQNEPLQNETEVRENVYGASFIGGAEISLGRFNLAVDWKPELHLNESAETFGWNGAAVSVRYILAKREKKKISDWKIFGGGKDNGKKDKPRQTKSKKYD